MCVYRGMDIGTSKPAGPSRADVPHHLLDLVDPDEEFTVAAVPAAARRRWRHCAPRRAMRCSSVARGSICAPWWTTSLSRVATRRWPPRWRRSSTRAGPRPADLHARLAALDPAGGGADGADAIAGGSCGRLEVTLGSGRPFSTFGPGLEAYPPRGIGAGRPLAADRGDRPPHRRPLRPHARGRPGRRGAGARRPPGRHLPDGPPGARLPRSAGPRGGRARPWPTASRRPCGGPGSSRVARPRGSAATHGCAGRGAPRRPGPAPRALAVHG